MIKHLLNPKLWLWVLTIGHTLAVGLPLFDSTGTVENFWGVGSATESSVALLAYALLVMLSLSIIQAGIALFTSGAVFHRMALLVVAAYVWMAAATSIHPDASEFGGFSGWIAPLVISAVLAATTLVAMSRSSTTEPAQLAVQTTS
ncbi:MAG: hypothetical protein AAGA65_15515 [Actinomycetota bacterium]